MLGDIQQFIGRVLGIIPEVSRLPYHQKSYIITLSTAIQRVK